MKNILLIILVVMVICFVAFVVALTISMMPTRGRQIGEYDNPQKALLVIDIQRDFTAENAQDPFPYKDAEKLIMTLNGLTKKAVKKGIAVIYLRQEFSGLFGIIFSKIFCRGKGIRGNPGTGFDERLFIVSDHMFSKPKGDAFSNPCFGAFLIENQINELYLTGLDAEFCVYHTAKGAKRRGYGVTVLIDAVLLLDEKKRADILDKYRKNNIILQRSEDFLENLDSGQE